LTCDLKIGRDTRKSSKGKKGSPYGRKGALNNVGEKEDKKTECEGIVREKTSHKGFFCVMGQRWKKKYEGEGARGRLRVGEGTSEGGE